MSFQGDYYALGDQIRELSKLSANFPNDKSYIGRSTGDEKLVSLRRLVCDRQRINKRDAVIENISFWEDSITAKLQFAVCYR